MADYISVTTLNTLAKQVLAQCEPLNSVIVCGELSNFTRHYKSGHLYFTLKDENSSIKCVMFRDKARLLGFEPQNGMMVLAYGRATIYERDGAFQLYADFMRPFGAGAAQMAFDALKKKLEAEGLFAAAHKRPLPYMPACIGIVTSKTGAALQDVLQVMGRRWPLTKLLLAPVSVQGFAAESTIVDGIRALDADARAELILVTRGGGSKEDLWVFNSERIARAAYACRKPVVSAVGHEIDYTILDYVADLRAPTPSAAAELCVPDKNELLQKIYILQQNIRNNMQARYQMCYNKYDAADAKSGMRFAAEMIDKKQQALKSLCAQTALAASQKQNTCRASLQQGAALAASLNPYAVLARGYAMVTDAAGEPKNITDFTAGGAMDVRDADAVAHCTIHSIEIMREVKTDENTEKL